MSDFMNNMGATRATDAITHAALMGKQKTDNKGELNMQDFLMLMVAELQNQSIDNNADTSQMLSQMVMMQMVEAMTNMTEASVMSYAASLVGKTVTVGQFDSNGKLQEIVGNVNGTGTMNGQQVIFVDDKYYYLNEIIAVGTLPAEKTEGTEKPDAPSENQNSDDKNENQDKVPEIKA